jgi:hypothetical protein
MENNNKTIEQFFKNISENISVPSYSEFSQLMHRPIKSPVTKSHGYRKTYGWMIRGFVMTSIALVLILPMVYSRGITGLETQIIFDEADGEVTLLEQEDMLIGKSVDTLFEQLLMITNN